MIVRFCLAGPQGPFLLGPEDLRRPFKTSPSEDHPCLSLRDYFESVRDLLLQEEARVLLKALLTQGHSLGLKDIHEIWIRLEKHGVLYHVAKVEIHAQALVSSLAVSTAVSGQAKAYLKKEYEVLQNLGNRAPTYVPRVYHLGQRIWGIDPDAGTLVMMVSQWLEGYHEWHLSLDSGDVSPRPRIWDSDAGYRWANPEEGFELYKQAAAILTLTYDLRTSRHIYPWHHAAGDFVIRPWGGRIRVMLATVRDYRPFPLLLGLNSMDPLMALVYFFLHLTLRIRMDRVEGLGELILADAPFLNAAVLGFREALRTIDERGGYPFGPLKDLFSLLRSFEMHELATAYGPLVDVYQEEDPEAGTLLEHTLQGHCLDLHGIIQGSDS